MHGDVNVDPEPPSRAIQNTTKSSGKGHMAVPMKKSRWVIVAVVVFLLMAVAGYFVKRAAEKTMAEAHAAWESGNKEAAVAKYKSVAKTHWDSWPKEDLTVMVGRIADFDADKGEADSAREWLEKARKRELVLNLESVAAKTILAKIDEEKAKMEQEKRAAEAAKQKLPAFKKLVKKYQNSPDRFASSADLEKFNKELAAIQEEFCRLPFDPTKNREEAKGIVELFEKELEHNYQGQLYRELEGEVREIYAKLTQ